MYHCAVPIDYDQYSHPVVLYSDAITEQWAADISALVSELSGRPVHLSMTELRRMSATHIMCVVEHCEHLVGLACLVVMDLPQGKRFLIETVVVHPQHRRAGIGRSLVAALIKQAGQVGQGQLSLTCNPTRIAAQALYRELGFLTADTTVLRIPVTAKG